MGQSKGETAAICGLFCCTCPSYPEACGGRLIPRYERDCPRCPP